MSTSRVTRNRDAGIRSPPTENAKGVLLFEVCDLLDLVLDLLLRVIELVLGLALLLVLRPLAAKPGITGQIAGRLLYPPHCLVLDVVDSVSVYLLVGSSPLPNPSRE
jgi:hypothetical protein